MKVYTTPDPHNDELQLFAVDSETGVRHSFRGYITSMEFEHDYDRYAGDDGWMYIGRRTSTTGTMEIQVTGPINRMTIPTEEATTEVVREGRELPSGE